MLTIEIDTSKLDLELIIRQIKGATDSALSSTGYHLSQEIREYIESRGNGTWKNLHPLSQLFYKKTSKSLWSARDKQQIFPYMRFGEFCRYEVTSSKNSSVLKTGFGIWGLIPKLQQIAAQMEKSREIKVSPQMRRMFAKTRGLLPQKQVPGQTYFPLRKSTQSIKVPARPLSPIFGKLEKKYVKFFVGRFENALERRLQEKRL